MGVRGGACSARRRRPGPRRLHLPAVVLGWKAAGRSGRPSINVDFRADLKGAWCLLKQKKEKALGRGWEGEGAPISPSPCLPLCLPVSLPPCPSLPPSLPPSIPVSLSLSPSPSPSVSPSLGGREGEGGRMRRRESDGGRERERGRQRGREGEGLMGTPSPSHPLPTAFSFFCFNKHQAPFRSALKSTLTLGRPDLPAAFKPGTTAGR